MITMRVLIKKQLLSVPAIRRSYSSYAERRAHRRADAFIVSFPKAGRTWLRAMIGKILCEGYGKEFTTELESLADSNVPYIRITHDGAHIPAEPLEQDKSKYRNKKVLFLVRDPRDTVVSYYFQCTKRNIKFTGDISTFIRDDGLGINRIINFMNIWARNQHVPREFLMVRYEDMHANPCAELRKVIDFLGINGIEDLDIRQAVDFGRFDNMLNLEKEGNLQGPRLRAGSEGDLDAYKVRKGKVGGYVEYLSIEDAKYVDDRVRENLDPIFGY